MSFMILMGLCLLGGIVLLIMGFTRLQVRDKRYNKGVKKKFNPVSIILFLVSGVLLYLSFRFYQFM